MNNIQSFESFTENVKNEEVNESIPFGSYYFNSRTEFEEHSDSLPEKGETKYLVFAHNSADLDGQTIRLQGGVVMGSATSKNILGIFDDEGNAMAAYNAFTKKPEGTFVSFSMGTLYAKSKFSFQYEETQGKLAKIKIR
ncbi:MAG: hypothetical protein CMC65_00070 [Flavobacteriaceae bacterium]|nr:hypothetical protein [Flavobacteriaceae bacterium]|tara:strand:- start:1967 stop:2383 length:417 start_codon:yes stop_codon:yes gene_type:complete